MKKYVWSSVIKTTEKILCQSCLEDRIDVNFNCQECGMMVCDECINTNNHEHLTTLVLDTNETVRCKKCDSDEIVMKTDYYQAEVTVLTNVNTHENIKEEIGEYGDSEEYCYECYSCGTHIRIDDIAQLQNCGVLE